MSNPAYEKYIEYLEKTYELLKKNEVVTPDEKKYEGGRNVKGEPHGFGKMVYPNGDIYEGQWINNLRNGTGSYKWPNGGIYEGDWKDGKKDGIGVFKYPDGYIYNGEWKDNKKHGKGVKTHKDGTNLNETWENGNLINSEGYGTITFNIKDVIVSDIRNYISGSLSGSGIYNGAIKNNMPHGDGLFNQNANIEYNGSWINGLFDGNGILKIEIENQRIVWDGQWKEGLLSGNGTCSEVEGKNEEIKIVRKGEWKNGLLNGQGEHLYENINDNYSEHSKGEFKEGSLHGQGLYKSNFMRDEGEFENGILYNGSFDDKINRRRGTTTNGSQYHEYY